MDAEILATRIQKKHDQLGCQQGWRLLYSPLSTIESAQIAFIGLQPGVSSRDSEHPKLFSEIGSSYEIEQWGRYPPGEAPLQRQVRMLFAQFGAKPAEVLAGNLVPFRSSNWSGFRSRLEAIDFGITLWMEVLKLAQRDLVITMSGPVTKEVSKALGIRRLEERNAGWGDIRVYRGYNDRLRLIGIPHLSRFRIMGRSQSAPAVNWLFEPIS
jgi:hypothetical protein